MTQYSETISLRPRPPFDFAKSLDFLCSFPPARAEQVVTSESLTKAVRADGQTIVFQIVSTGTNEDPQLECTLFCAAPLSASTIAAARDRVSFYLSLDDDLQPFYAIGQKEPAFAPVIDKLHGYHQVKFSTPFENACWAVLAQRTPMPVAQKTKQTLVNLFGNHLEVDGTVYSAFPDVEQLANCSIEELLGLIRNKRKASYLFDVVKAFSQVSESFLRTGQYEAVKEWLLAIRGIGSWSASFVLIRGLGRTEEVPPDKAMLKAAAKVYGRTFSKASFREVASQYKSWQGYWGHYLRVYT